MSEREVYETRAISRVLISCIRNPFVSSAYLSWASDELPPHQGGDDVEIEQRFGRYGFVSF